MASGCKGSGDTVGIDSQEGDLDTDRSAKRTEGVLTRPSGPPPGRGFFLDSVPVSVPSASIVYESQCSL